MELPLRVPLDFKRSVEGRASTILPPSAQLDIDNIRIHTLAIVQAPDAKGNVESAKGPLLQKRKAEKARV